MGARGRRSRIVWPFVIAVGACALGGMLSTPVATAQAETELRFDGEATTVSAFPVAENAVVDAVAARQGKGGLRIAAVDAPGYAQWDPRSIGPGYDQLTAEFWVRLESRGEGESVDLLTIANAQGERNFDFFVAGGSQRLKWDLSREDWNQSRIVDDDQWYFIEVTLSYAGPTHWAEIRIDGEDWGRIESPGAPTTVESIIFGAKMPKTHTQDYDDVVVRLSSSQPGPRPDPTPEVGAGATEDESGLDAWRDWFDALVRSWIDRLL